MADNIIKRFIEIVVDTSRAITGLNNTEDALNDVDNATDRVVQSTERLSDSAGRTEGSLRSLSGGFRALGLGIKALGIGLIIEAFNILKEVFASNQTVVDGFNITIGVLKMAFNDFFNLITNNVDNIKKFFKDIFENPKKSLIDFGNAIKENLIERFISFFDMIKFVSQGLIKLFKGDLKGALDDFTKAGKETVDIYTGVANTVDKVTEAVSEYVEAAVEATKANIELNKSIERQIIINEGLINSIEAAAEKQRQIRDNDLLAITDRIAANEELSKSIDKQARLERENASLKVRQATLNFSLAKTEDNRLKLLSARNLFASVENKIEAVRSEQIANRISLFKELDTFEQTAFNRAVSRSISRFKFDESLQRDENIKFSLNKLRIENEIIANDKQLVSDIQRYKAGTQARVNAEQDYLDRKQLLNQELVKLNSDNNFRLEKDNIDYLERIIQTEGFFFETRLASLNTQSEIIKNSTFLTDKERTDALRANSEERIRIEEEEVQAKIGIQQEYLGFLEQSVGVIGIFNEKSKDLQKAGLIAEGAISIAKIIINTNSANIAAVLKWNLAAISAGANPVAIAAAQAALTAEKTRNWIGAGLSIAGVVAATGKGLASIGKGGSLSSGGAGGSDGGGSPAQFNVVGTSLTNQLASALGSKGTVVKAQVVSSEVTNAQALDRNRVQQSVFL